MKKKDVVETVNNLKNKYGYRLIGLVVGVKELAFQDKISFFSLEYSRIKTIIYNEQNKQIFIYSVCNSKFLIYIED